MGYFWKHAQTEQSCLGRTSPKVLPLPHVCRQCLAAHVTSRSATTFETKARSTKIIRVDRVARPHHKVRRVGWLQKVAVFRHAVLIECVRQEATTTKLQHRNNARDLAWLIPAAGSKAKQTYRKVRRGMIDEIRKAQTLVSHRIDNAS
jgi:hypothetical protein